MLRYCLLFCFFIVLHSSKLVKSSESSLSHNSAARQGFVIGEESVTGQDVSPDKKPVPDKKPQSGETKYVQALNDWMFDIFLLYLKGYFVLGVLLIVLRNVANTYLPINTECSFVFFRIILYTVLIYLSILLAVGIVLFVIALYALSRVWPYFAIFVLYVISGITDQRNHKHECIVITLLVNWCYGASFFYVSVWYIYYWVCEIAWQFLNTCYTQVVEIRTEDQFRNWCQRMMQGQYA